MKSEGKFLSPDIKISAIIDCCATSPYIKGAAYSSSSIKKSYIIPGMRNKHDGCPDLYATMTVSDIDFQKNCYLEVRLLKHITVLTAEMYKNQEGVPKSKFDKLGFPIGKDDQGN